MTHKVRVGSVAIEIRPHAKGWQASYYDANRVRRRITSKDLDHLKARVREIAASLAEQSVNRLVPADEWAEFQAWKRRRANTVDVTLDHAIDAFLAERRQHVTRSTRDVYDLERRLHRLADAFPARHIGDLSTDDLSTFLTSLDVSARTRKNYRSAMVRLWKFARRHKWVSVDDDRLTVAEIVPTIDVPVQDIGILTPDQMRTALDNVHDHWRPFLLLAGFAGLRAEEIIATRSPAKRPVDWSDIDCQSATIRIRPETSKGRRGRARIVPIAENLNNRLRDIHQGAGPVVTRSPHDYNEFPRLAKSAGLDRWPQNGLRHSYGTYRMALIRNAAQVSEEMGNGISDVRQHYDRVVQESDGQAWFSV